MKLAMDPLIYLREGFLEIQQHNLCLVLLILHLLITLKLTECRRLDIRRLLDICRS